jgi:hypothetical protein
VEMAARIETGKRVRYKGGNDGNWNAIVGVLMVYIQKTIMQ